MSAAGHTNEPDPADGYAQITLTPRRTPLRRLSEAWNNAELFSAPPRAEWSSLLRRVRTVGFALLILEFVGMCVWSYIQVRRFALTPDFANYYQAAHLLANGVVNPLDTIFPIHLQGHPTHFWANAMEGFIIPVAVAYRIWPHAETIKWMQNLALVATQAIAFSWICDIAAHHEQNGSSRRSGPLLAAFGLLMLIGNPWFIWTSTVDVHGEPFALAPTLALARNLHRGRGGRAWLWAAVAIFSTGIGATYTAAVGASAMLSGRVRLKQGALIALAGIAWFGLLSELKLLIIGGPATFESILTGNTSRQTSIGDAGYLFNTGRQITWGHIVKGAVQHPLNVVRALWSNHLNFWATISPSGFAGLFWIPVFLPAALVLFEGGFTRQFGQPGFQNLAVGPLVAVGTVAIGAHLLANSGARLQRTIAAGGVLLSLYTIGWFSVWVPRIPGSWLNISPAAANVLRQLKARIGPDDEVISDHAFVGGFADRKWIYFRHIPSVTNGFQVRHGRPVWIILSPSQGIAVGDAASTLDLITVLERDPSIHLEVRKDGIWAFRWLPPEGTHTLRFPPPTVYTISGANLAGTSANPIPSAGPQPGYASNSGTPGYVVDGGYLSVTTGVYRTIVSMSATHPANVEVWDDTRNTLLRRVVVRHTAGRIDIPLTVRIRATSQQPGVTGWGPWQIEPVLSSGDTLEVRVWTAAPTSTVKVYSLTMKRLRS